MIRKKLFASAIPPASVVREHKKGFEGMHIFYRTEATKLFRGIIKDIPNDMLAILLRYSINVKRNVMFIHKSKIDACMEELTFNGFENFMRAEPYERDWN